MSRSVVLNPRDAGDVRACEPLAQLRHKPPTPLARPRELLIACAELHSAVNLSQIVRAAGSAGVARVIACGQPRIDRDIARDAADHVALEARRSLPPVLARLKREGYEVVALEQTHRSESLCAFAFARRSVVVVGNERHGLTDDVLAVVDRAVEIPVYGLPYSHNVGAATAIALYEYCRQFPSG